MLYDVFSNNKGNLRSLDFTKLPFMPQRMFIIDNVPKNTTRGGHGHKTCLQYFICLNGRITFHIIDLNLKIHNQVTLTKGQDLYLLNNMWAQQHYVEEKSELLCLCSEPYDKNDYIYELK